MKTIKLIIFIIICVVILICVVSLIMPTPKQNTRSSSVRDTINLPLQSLTTSWKSNKDWRIVSDSIGKGYIEIINGNILKATYPKGSYNPSSRFHGGFQFNAQPKVFPSQQITLTYQVLFPIGFRWVKGGKLPGLWIGNMGANGGNHLPDGSSFRVMWRANGEAEAYLYLPRQPNKTFYEQKGYVYNGQFGESLWRGQFTFETNAWNNVTLYIKVNTPNEANGVIGLTINNISQHIDNVLWIKNNKQQNVNGVMMHTFFGGNDESWATPVEQNVYFKNFVVSNDIF